MKKKLITSFFAFYTLLLPAATISYSQKMVSPHQTDVIAHIQTTSDEHINEKNIVLSSNHKDVQLSAPLFHNNTLTTQATKTVTSPIDANVHITLVSNKQTKPTETIFPIKFQEYSNNSTKSLQQLSTHASSSNTGGSFRTEKGFFQNIQHSIKVKTKHVSEFLKDNIVHSKSWTLKLLFALILGILLSLTPCIYPMIPITVGILQAQGSKSILKNFSLSLMYTLGLATTFSLLGLLAASSGEAFGSIMGNPIFILCFVALLAYFAFSMFGLYTLHIPRFLQKKRDIGGGGSYLSIFVFGLASGSVASPCLSPGLAFLLAMVATMANKFIGFLLLFAFGVGVSTPLLVIGTFSGSMNVLPKAGMWMLEVQKLFGFMLLGLCFFYLSNILPWHVILIMLTIFALCSGLYYLRSINKHDSAVWKNIKSIFGIIGIALSLYLAVESFQEIYYPSLDNDPFEQTWYTDYDKAVTDAKHQHKKLFVDFGATFCTLCTHIKNSVIKHPSVIKTLSEDYVFVYVNGDDSGIEPYKTLKERYSIQGFPTLLVVNPKDGEELKRWQGEIEDESISDVINELEKYSK